MNKLSQWNILLCVACVSLFSNASIASSCYDELKVKAKASDSDDVWTKSNFDYKYSYMQINDRSVRPKITECEISHGFVVFWNEEEGSWYKTHQEAKIFKTATSNFFVRNEEHGYVAKLYPLRIRLSKQEKSDKAFVRKYSQFRSGVVLWELVKKNHPYYYWLLGGLTESNQRPGHLGPESYTEYIERLKFDVAYFNYQPDLREDLRENGFVVFKSLSEINTWYRMHQDNESFDRYTKGTFRDGIQNDLYSIKPSLSLEDQRAGAVVVYYPPLQLWEIVRKGHPKYVEANKSLSQKLRLAGITRSEYNNGKRKKIKRGDVETDKAALLVNRSMPAPPKRLSVSGQYTLGANLNPLLRAHFFSSSSGREAYERMAQEAKQSYGLNFQQFDAQANQEFVTGFRNGYIETRNKRINEENLRNNEFWLSLQKSGYRNANTRVDENGYEQTMGMDSLEWEPPEREKGNGMIYCGKRNGEDVYQDITTPNTGFTAVCE